MILWCLEVAGLLLILETLRELLNISVCLVSKSSRFFETIEELGPSDESHSCLFDKTLALFGNDSDSLWVPHGKINCRNAFLNISIER